MAKTKSAKSNAVWSQRWNFFNARNKEKYKTLKLMRKEGNSGILDEAMVCTEVCSTDWRFSLATNPIFSAGSNKSFLSCLMQISVIFLGSIPFILLGSNTSYNQNSIQLSFSLQLKTHFLVERGKRQKSAGI